MTAAGSGRLFLVAFAIALMSAGPLEAGTFVDSEFLDPDLVLHPHGYDGNGGELTISVCIDPTSPNAAAMAIPTHHAVAIWNDLVPTIANVELAAIPAGRIDFESVLLHELGHAVFALGHPNLGTDTGIPEASDPVTNFTKTTKGANGSFDIEFAAGAPVGNEGPDDVAGSSDDLRADDINLHWFEKGVNNPFQASSATLDSTTLSRDLGDLPAGDSFPANGDFTVSALPPFDVPNTEAVMQQGTFTDEAQRSLVSDDVVTARYAMSGIDELEGTPDDYTVALGFSESPPCDVMLTFDNAETLFASTVLVHNPISGAPSNHRVVTSAQVFFNELQPGDWHFSENRSPDAPHSPNPQDNASGVSPTTGLSWTGGDPDPGDAVTYDVFLEKDNPDPGVLLCDDIATPTCAPASTLDSGSLYFWRVVATDNHGATTPGPTWSFLTTCAENLVLDSTDIDSRSTRRASATITAGPAFAVKGPNGDLTLVAGQSIILRDGFGVEADARFTAQISDVCSVNRPPLEPGVPNPPDGASGVPPTTGLSWTGGDPDPGDAVTYDVFLEKDNPDPGVLLCDDIATPTCAPASTLDSGSLYFWRVVATDNHGAATPGPTWSFLTTCAENLVLDSTDIESQSTRRASATITAGPAFAVKGPNGDLTLVAGQSIILRDGFGVEADARFTAQISDVCGSEP